MLPDLEQQQQVIVTSVLWWWYSWTISSVDKIDYSNDTATAVEKGPLSSARNQIAATGNSSFGYFSNATSGAVDKFDYSNDTATAVEKEH